MSDAPSSPSTALLLLGPAFLIMVGLIIWSQNKTEGPKAAKELPPIPKIDVHTHLGLSSIEEAVAIFESQNIKIALNASGGYPGGKLEKSMKAVSTFKGRVQPYCNLPMRGMGDPRWTEAVVAMLDDCKAQGAVGLKISKALGLGVLGPDGELLPVDAEVLDPVFEKAGELSLPILIHAGDPVAFFSPADENNERLAELSAHPGWSFDGPIPGLPGKVWPEWETVFAQFVRRVERHPNTKFLGAHFGNAPEYPARVSKLMDELPNLYVETGARIPEIGRYPAAKMRALMIKHQKRILFGTDFSLGPYGVTLGSSGAEPDKKSRIPEFFAAHWRYFETNDRKFAHPTPIQGNWTIDGIGLPRDVTERIYWKNAAELFGLSL